MIAKDCDADSRGERATTVLIDTGPDMRQQLLDAEVDRLDAVVYTHSHADHVHGIDDLRPLALYSGRRIRCYGASQTMRQVLKSFPYIFGQTHTKGYPPVAEHHELPATRSTVTITGEGGALDVRYFPVVHGTTPTLGFRIGSVAYTPDVSDIPERSVPVLENLDCWIVDALRYRPHVSHFTVEIALAWVARLKPKRAVLTNLNVELDYEALRTQLPSHIEPGFDGMDIAAL